MKRTLRMFGLMLCTILLCASFTSCGDDDDDGPESTSIVGTWRLSLKDGIEMWYCQYEFNSNGTLKVKDWTDDNEPSNYEAGGKYTISADVLTITVDGEGSESYKFKLNGNNLIIYDYEEDGANVFVRIK